MTSKFQVLQINSQAEVERYGIQEFAAEFGHKQIGLPVIVWFWDGDLVAYVEIRQTPILYPAVHPKISPRTFLEGGRMLYNLLKEEFEGGFVIYDRRSALFEPEAMERLGFALSPLKFFEVNQQEAQ